MERAARLDVLARTVAGALINVEVQVTNRYDIEKRTLFYWARLYHGQLSIGQKFSDLRKTVVINVMGFNLFSDEDYHNVFHLSEDETGKVLCDDLEIHLLELEKVKGLKRKPQDALEAWMMYLNNLEGEELEAIAMENPAIRKAMTIEEIFHKSAMERRLYELREKALRDELTMLDGARAEAKQDDIIKFVTTRFKTESLGLQDKLRALTDLQVLDDILTRIFAADSAEDAVNIIQGTVEKALQ